MSHPALKVSLARVAVCFIGPGEAARGLPQAAGATYQVVKACSLLSLGEVKKLAPWEPHFDKWADGEEEPIGTAGSSCNYPSVFIQVMAFLQSFLDTLRKTQFPSSRCREWAMKPTSATTGTTTPS